MAKLIQLQQDFERDVRRLVSKRCNSCGQFRYLLLDLKTRGEPANIKKFQSFTNSGRITYADAQDLVNRWISKYCVGEDRSSKYSLARAIQGPFFSFIQNAENLLDTGNNKLLVVPVSSPPNSYIILSQIEKMDEISRNPYLQQLMYLDIQNTGLIREWTALLALFDQHLDILRIVQALREKDTSNFDSTMSDARLVISAATINGNERASDKFGKLMELVELRFGKKPPRVTEDKFMESIATELQSRIAKLDGVLCVGVKYIQEWANRQFIQIK